jgi:DNA-binding Lrp family transcriptional regulator
VGEQLSLIPEVQEVHEVAGDDCFFIKVVSRDAESLGHFSTRKYQGDTERRQHADDGRSQNIQGRNDRSDRVGGADESAGEVT